MDFRIVGIFVRSASFEIINGEICASPAPYAVILNGKAIAENRRDNVFSLYGLTPATEYELTVRMGSDSVRKIFVTRQESFRLDVRRFGAVGDGKSLDTAALQAAILCCPEHGTVRIPSGVYRTGPLFLKSDITLELEKGATLLGTEERGRYPVLPGTTFAENGEGEYYLGMWEGNPLASFASLLTGIHVKNVDIVGEGVLDGNAGNGDWWKSPKKKRGAWRPRMLFLNGCENIRVQGVTFRNSYSWTIHPYLSRKIDFFNIRVFNDPDSPNTDGLDIESCQDVQVLGADISVGDDCIVLKSGKLYLGRKLKAPTCGVVVRNCLLQRGHGAVVIGSEVSAGVHDVLASQCVFEGTDRGLRIKTRRGRGKDSVLDAIRLKDVRMNRVLTPFAVNMFYNCDPDGHGELVQSKKKFRVDDLTPCVGSILCENVRCENTGVAGMFFYGLPEMPIRKIEMKNVSIRFAEDAQPGAPEMMDQIEKVKKLGVFACNIQSFQLKGVTLSGYEGEKIQMRNVAELVQEEW